MSKKKCIWNIIKCLVFVMFVMSATRISGTNVSAATNGSNWYNSVLNSQNASYKVSTIDFNQKVKVKTKYRKNYSYYKLLDINQDGVKELLLSNNPNGNSFSGSVLILTYYKGKVKPLYCFDGIRENMRIKGKTLDVYHGYNDEGNLRCYNVSNGALKKTVTIGWRRDRNQNKHYYYKNGKGCSNSTYTALCRKYWENGKKISFNRIRISKAQAINKVKNKMGSKFGYFCMENPVAYNGKEYYVIDVEAKVGNHYSRITQYLVSLDGTVCREGYYYSGKIGFY